MCCNRSVPLKLFCGTFVISTTFDCVRAKFREISCENTRTSLAYFIFAWAHNTFLAVFAVQCTSLYISTKLAREIRPAISYAMHGHVALPMDKRVGEEMQAAAVNSKSPNAESNPDPSHPKEGKEETLMTSSPDEVALSATGVRSKTHWRMAWLLFSYKIVTGPEHAVREIFERSLHEKESPRALMFTHPPRSHVWVLLVTAVVACIAVSSADLGFSVVMLRTLRFDFDRLCFLDIPRPRLAILLSFVRYGSLGLLCMVIVAVFAIARAFRVVMFFTAWWLRRRVALVLFIIPLDAIMNLVAEDSFQIRIVFNSFLVPVGFILVDVMTLLRFPKRMGLVLRAALTLSFASLALGLLSSYISFLSRKNLCDSGTAKSDSLNTFLLRRALTFTTAL